MQQVMASQDEMHTLQTQQAGDDCMQHQGGAGCPGHADASGHCAGCVFALLPPQAVSPAPTVTSKIHSTNDGFTSQHTSSLYRPPRG